MTKAEYDQATGLVNEIKLYEDLKDKLETAFAQGLTSIKWTITFDDGNVVEVTNPDATKQEDIFDDVIEHLDDYITAQTTALTAI